MRNIGKISETVLNRSVIKQINQNKVGIKKGAAVGSDCAFFSDYATDPVVSLTLCFLILMGGLGFLVWDDVYENRLNIKKYRLHTKLVLITNLILVVGGTILFLIFESNVTLADMDISGRLVASVFDAVTPRTAGFNTTDTGALSPASQILTWILIRIYIRWLPCAISSNIVVLVLSKINWFLI